MGVTISYRGSMADIERVEDFEDRVIDLALEIGGHARVWRSFCDDDPQRAVRGVILELYPGQETTSLLVSPEGWLINFTEIEGAEKGQLADPPWCFVKTLSDVAREMLEACEDEQDEPWRESLPDAIRDADEDALDDGCDDERHPLIERAMDLHVRLFDIATAGGQHANENFQSLMGGAGEMLGGLSQALGGRNYELLSGWGLVQLKRSLRGAAFAFGMLFPLRADGLLTPAEFKELCEAITSLQSDIDAELARLREARES